MHFFEPIPVRQFRDYMLSEQDVSSPDPASFSRYHHKSRQPIPARKMSSSSKPNKRLVINFRSSVSISFAETPLPND